MPLDIEECPVAALAHAGIRATFDLDDFLFSIFGPSALGREFIVQPSGILLEAVTLTPNIFALDMVSSLVPPSGMTVRAMPESAFFPKGIVNNLRNRMPHGTTAALNDDMSFAVD